MRYLTGCLSSYLISVNLQKLLQKREEKKKKKKRKNDDE